MNRTYGIRLLASSGVYQYEKHILDKNIELWNVTKILAYTEIELLKPK